mmetsp:Transcript_2899/g.4434  ORF Transcript_2899/g.4434 Transcript_2899/m.4434 type:complete len:403 (+) Transcript_2899:1136-2344(+)
MLPRFRSNENKTSRMMKKSEFRRTFVDDGTATPRDRSTSPSPKSSPPPGEVSSQYWDSRQGRYDLKKLDIALSYWIEDLATALMGEPNIALSSEEEMRYGNKGSFCVTTDGKFQGRWYDFETGENGGPLKLIQAKIDSDFRTALHYALKFVVKQEHEKGSVLYNNNNNNGSSSIGDHSSYPPSSSLSSSSSSSPRLAYDVSENAASRGTGVRYSKEERRNKTREYAMRLYRESRPIMGSVAEKYLREERKISAPVDAKSVRFHPMVLTGRIDGFLKLPALIAVLRDAEGNPSSIQATYLDPQTGRKRANLNIPKRTYGALKGAAVTISNTDRRAAEKISFIAEGLETALSIGEVVKGHHIMATLGKHNIKHLLGHDLGDTVVLCIDNDGNGTTTTAASCCST